ncbi:MAG: TonB-dependent receptor [Bacteroides sp.]|nr:TonB-dependent receptor [Bacteroides sp.]
MRISVRHILLLSIVVLSSFGINAKQTLTGKVTDPDGQPIQGIIVRLYCNGKIKAFANSDKAGDYRLTADTLIYPVKLTFSSRSFRQEETELSPDAMQKMKSEIPTMVMTPESYTLQEVTVKVPRTRVKGDTIVYDVAAHTSPGDRSIEDVIRKLPGVSVSDDGQISYDGEPINNFYIEGLNLMGNGYAVASQNIRPSDVSSISVYERHQPKRALQGVQDSKRAALNLKLKKSSMLKPVGYVEGGAGDGDEVLWLGNLYTMFISPVNQTIVNAKGNNAGTVLKPFRNIAGKAGSLFSDEAFGRPSLKADRYLDNTSLFVTANTLFKLKEDLTFTVNSSYANERGEFGESSQTTYLSADTQDQIYQEIVDNSLRRHDVEVAAKIENNAPKLYLNDRISFSGQFRDNGYGIVTSEDVRQDLDGKTFSFKNEFSSIIRTGSNVVNVKSETSFVRSPYFRMRSVASDGNVAARSQSVCSQSFQNVETAEWTKQLSGRQSIGIEAGFSIDADRFISSGSRETTQGETLSENRLRGHEIAGTVTPSYTIRYSKMTATLKVPLTYASRRYSDILTGERYPFDDFLADVNLSLFFKFSQTDRIQAAIGRKHELGDIYSLAVNPLYTTFRNSTVLGNGTLLRSLNNSANLAYTHMDPLNAFYVRGMVMFSNRKSNSLPVSDVGQSGTSTGALRQDATANTLNLLLNTTKTIRSWNTTFGLTFSGMGMERETSRAATVIKARSTTGSIAGDIETEQFNSVLRSDLNATYMFSVQTFSGDIPTNHFGDFSLRWKVSVFPVKRLEIYGSLGYRNARLAEDTYKESTFVDAGARYAFGKFSLELTARNLTDTRRYDYTVYHSLDICRYEFSLRPAEALLTLKYNF